MICKILCFYFIDRIISMFAIRSFKLFVHGCLPYCRLYFVNRWFIIYFINGYFPTIEFME